MPIDVVIGEGLAIGRPLSHSPRFAAFSEHFAERAPLTRLVAVEEPSHEKRTP